MSHPRRRTVALLLSIALSPLAAASAHAADAYPTKPIRLVVPFPAGGTTDILARAVSAELSKLPGWNVVVDNKPGAGGNIGSDIVAKSAPDGYTLLMGTVGTHGINQSLYGKLPYDPIKDFTPVARMGNLPFMLVINPKLPVKTVGELIAYAKSHPGMSYASGNSTGIVSGATLARMAHVDLLHVPYKSTPPAMTDVIAGQVPMMFVDVAAGIANVKAGRMRALAVTTAQRSRLLPDLPPIGDTPELKGFDITSWNGVFAPAKTPQPIVDRLNRELSKIAASKEVAPKFEALGFEAFGQTPQQFAGFVGSELVKWNKLVKDAGIQPE